MNSMRLLMLYLVLCWPFASSAEILKKGMKIEKASKAMKEEGYKEAALDMGTRNRENRLQMWSVDQGVLIVGYSTKTQKIVHLSYYVSDERAKAFRKAFNWGVLNFDTASGVMTIKTKQKWKTEEGGAKKPQCE